MQTVRLWLPNGSLEPLNYLIDLECPPLNCNIDQEIITVRETVLRRELIGEPVCLWDVVDRRSYLQHYYTTRVT